MGLGYTLFVKPLLVLTLALGAVTGIYFLPEYWPDHRMARYAILNDDAAALRRYLERRLDPNDRAQWRSWPRATVGRASSWSVGGQPDLGPADESLLGVALRDCKGVMAAMLVTAGADVNARGRDGGSVLWHAAACGHVAVVKAMLARGADVNARQPDGGTPLWERTNLGWRHRPLEAGAIRALEEAGALRP